METPPAPLLGSAPRAHLLASRVLTAPAPPEAPPQQPEASPWPPQPASPTSKDDDVPLGPTGRRAVALQQLAFGECSAPVLSTLDALASSLSEAEQSEAAEATLRQALPLKQAAPCPQAATARPPLSTSTVAPASASASFLVAAC